jgi:hypothetical protein
MRSNLRETCSDIAAWIDDTPFFWIHQLASPRIPTTSFHESLHKTRGHQFCLTIRADNLFLFTSSYPEVTYSSVDHFIFAAAAASLPFMAQCAVLHLSAADPVVAGHMLGRVREFSADSLQAFTFTFDLSPTKISPSPGSLVSVLLCSPASVIRFPLIPPSPSYLPITTSRACRTIVLPNLR